MSYSVEITPAVLAKIRSWGLPRAVHTQALSWLLNDLPANPDGLLGERVVPYAGFAYRFTLTAEGPIPSKLHFFFVVAREEKAEKLIVFGAELTQEDKGEN